MNQWLRGGCAPNIYGMSPTAGPRRASVCITSSEANSAIREFMAARTGRPLLPEEAEEYEQLLTIWSAATQERTGKATQAQGIVDSTDGSM